MDVNQIKESSVGHWESIAPEIRPSSLKNEEGLLKPFYLTRKFTLNEDDTFELIVTNLADPYGKVLIANMAIRGHIEWLGDHPIAPGAQKVNFTADISYVVTPKAQGFADVLNKYTQCFAEWKVDEGQDIIRKAFPPFGLAEGQLFKEYDLTYVLGDLLFWGARNVDGRGFDIEENRPTNLQIPLLRQK
ncbi:hypothetical protein [Mucilaginibacter ginsenosidivorax]|uniref:APCDD1 domain-containing protein n=1 Tax=Mucilaginibacter ginsenosidivorax TaxID=862126 RepID=A0A5B8W7N8_9SPHI|nr:hypothetical protein [Mucilaginibacter ginsenosidivorax]QEC78922.1 hypothetical protein FSB76_24325 [Mucilaginibacter ginsenosidivorax]